MSDRAAFERERLVSIIIDKGMMRRDVACDVADAILAQQSANIHRAAGVLDAAGAVTMYGQGRRERGQISARTMRELELAADHLRDLAVATRDRKRL